MVWLTDKEAFSLLNYYFTREHTPTMERTMTKLLERYGLRSDMLEDIDVFADMADKVSFTFKQMEEAESES